MRKILTLYGLYQSVAFEVATEIDGSLAISFRFGDIAQLRLAFFQQGENVKICNEIATLRLNVQRNLFAKDRGARGRST